MTRGKAVEVLLLVECRTDAVEAGTGSELVKALDHVPHVEGMFCVGAGHDVSHCFCLIQDRWFMGYRSFLFWLSRYCFCTRKEDNIR